VGGEVATSDRGVAGSERSREGEWKARRQSGSHRRLDVKRRKGGGSNGERGHKKSMQDVELAPSQRDPTAIAFLCVAKERARISVV